MSVWWFVGAGGFYWLAMRLINWTERRETRRLALADNARELEALVEATRENGRHRLGASQSRDERVIVAIITNADYSRIERGEWPPLLHKERS